MTPPMVIRHVFDGRPAWYALGGFLLSLTGLVHQPAVGQRWDIKQDIDPQHVVGHQDCAACHQAEVAAWRKSHHATDAWQLLKKGAAAKIAKELGIRDATEDRRCTTCHATQKQTQAIQGISCESCHGAAGPKDAAQPGWFTLHSNFGPGLDPKDKASREQETETNHVKRIELCDARGMRRSEHLYALSKNCLECHTVPSETLVNKGGHPTGSKGFEFVEWAQGEVRHNFQRDATKNAAAATLWVNAKIGRTAEGHKRLMYVVGQLADLAVSLRNRASATSRGKFLDAANKRILDAQDNLEEIDKKLKIDALKPVMDALRPVKRSTLRRVNAKDKQTYGEIADAADRAGRTIAASLDGGAWQAVDRKIKKGKGKVFQP